MINTTISILKCILDFALFFWFTSLFLNNKTKTWANFTVIVGLALLLFVSNQLHIAIFNTFMALVCALAINFVLFEGKWSAKLICSVVEVVLVVICEFIPIVITATNQMANLNDVTDITIRNAGFNFLSTGLFCLIIVLTRLFYEKLRKINQNITLTNYIGTIFVPIISIVIVYSYLYINTDTTNSYHTLIVFFGLLVINAIVIIADNSLQKRYYLQNQIDKLSAQEKLNTILISQQDQFISELRNFAHDYKKQLAGLNALIATGEWSKVDVGTTSKYIDELMGSIKSQYKYTAIKTLPLRVIVSQVQVECIKHDITFSLDIDYGDFDFLSFPDIYSLFENLLDNALYACVQMDNNTNKEIYFRIVRKKHLIYIEVKNTKQNTVTMKNGRFISSKSDSVNHGRGIRNIERVVNKHGGYTRFEYTEDIFKVAITLPAS